MTLANNYNPTKQLANGVTTSFTFNYDMINEDYAAVYQEVDGVQTIVDSDLYTVEFNNNGGNVIFKTAPAAGVYIVIGRSVPFNQETPYKTSSGFPANRVEENLDKLTAMNQQLANESDRSPKIPLGTAGVDLNLPAPSAGKALVWNDEANALVNSTDEFNDIVPDATAQANIATQKASEAAGSATAAANSASAALTSESNAASSASAALTSQNAAAASAEEASQYAISASFGNIGDIKYTTRIDIPNGGAWCNGAEYTKTAFPDLYQMLVDGKLQKTDYATFDSSVSANGSCGFFALDTTSEKFKVPLLKDVYIKAGDTPSMFGAESLPDITLKTIGNGDSATMWHRNYDFNSGLARGDGDSTGYSGSTVQNVKISNWGNEKYQDGSKVNPDHVVYRYYVVLYSSAAEASVAQAAEFINEFPDKYNTHIEQGGANVSGGQKQRLCIARALLKKPKILILDDSTSAVDTKTDALIRKAFREEIPDTTKIIIAQRIVSVEDADKILVMDGGKIVDMGTHEELLKTSSIYREVYESQTKGKEAEDDPLIKRIGSSYWRVSPFPPSAALPHNRFCKD